MSIDISLEREQDFWDNVRKTDDCWEWMGYVDKAKGVGLISFDGTRIGAHRISWILHNKTQTLLPHHQVKHVCRNKRCVRPSHLKLVKMRPKKGANVHKNALGGVRYTGEHEPPRTAGRPKWKDFESYVRGLQQVNDQLSAVRSEITAARQVLDILDPSQEVTIRMPAEMVELLAEQSRAVDAKVMQLSGSFFGRLDEHARSLAHLTATVERQREAIETQSALIRSLQTMLPRFSGPSPKPMPRSSDPVAASLMTPYRQVMGVPESPTDADYIALRMVFDLAMVGAPHNEAAVERFMRWLDDFAESTRGQADADRSPGSFARFATS